MAFEDFPGAGYIRLRGLPFSAGTAEVAEFLEDFAVPEDKVLIGVNYEGRPSGEAWVQLPDKQSADMAKQMKDRKRVGQRYVEVFSCTFEDTKYARRDQAQLETGGASSFPDLPGAGYLRLRGLPFHVTAAEVADLFAEFGVTDTQVVMGTEGATKRPSGEAWIQLESEAMATQARKAKDRARIERRYIEVFPSTASEAAKAGSRPTQDPNFRKRGADAGSAGSGSNQDWGMYYAQLGYMAAQAQSMAGYGGGRGGMADPSALMGMMASLKGGGKGGSSGGGRWNPY